MISRPELSINNISRQPVLDIQRLTVHIILLYYIMICYMILYTSMLRLDYGGLGPFCSTHANLWYFSFPLIS